MPEDFMKLYQKALAGLETGGKKLEASLQEIEEGKRQAIAGGQQALTRGGLAGTTVMGAVPLAAEKGAARKRLAARGEAEQTYLTTLASFAAFAQRGIEAQKEREFQAGLARYGARQAGLAERTATMRERGAATRAGREQGWMFQSLIGGGGGGQAQQFPSLYGQDQFGAAPSLMGDGGGADTEWPTMAPFGGAVYGTQEAFETSLEPQMQGAISTAVQQPIQPTAGRYAPQSAAEAIAAGKAGYYGSQGQQLKPYTRADAERLGF